MKILVLVFVLGAGAPRSQSYFENADIALLVSNTNELYISLKLSDKDGNKEDLGPMTRSGEEEHKGMGVYTIRSASLSMSVQDVKCFDVFATEEILVLMLIVTPIKGDDCGSKAFNYLIPNSPDLPDTRPGKSTTPSACLDA